MLEHEILEAQGQTTIFDYIEHIPSPKALRSFLQGEKVKLRLYVDEVEYVQQNHPYLMEPGIIFENHGSYYSVKFGSELLKVDADKLVLV